jgi:hypothetical protein
MSLPQEIHIFQIHLARDFIESSGYSDPGFTYPPVDRKTGWRFDTPSQQLVHVKASNWVL